MSSDSEVPPAEDTDSTERMDRLRALLTKPIKIPESASSDGEDADYSAPVAAAAAPKGAKTAMTPQETPPKGTKAPVETPPAVKAAAEALDRLTDEEKESGPDEAAQSGKKPSRSRRTWADAYLAKPDKPLTPEEVRAELTGAIKEQGAGLREHATKQAEAQGRASAQAIDEATSGLATRLEGLLDEQRATAEQAASAGTAETARLEGLLDELTATAEALRTDLDAARTAATAAAESAATATAAARTQAEAATKKAATATTFAWVGIALAAVAAVLAVVL